MELLVPDLGNNSDVSVVDVMVKVGDSVEIDTPLVTLETDKASLDVPATSAGTVAEVLLKRGDKVSKGTVIARVEAGASQGTASQSPRDVQPAQASQPAAQAANATAGNTQPAGSPGPAAPPARAPSSST